MRVYLNVPYAEREFVKRKGAHWDQSKKQWFVENKTNLYPFLKYMSELHRAPCKPSQR